MSYMIHCDFCGLAGEPTGRKYTSPNQWREIRMNEGHGMQEEVSLHACPECEAKHLWPRTQHPSLEDLVRILGTIAECLNVKPEPAKTAGKHK